MPTESISVKLFNRVSGAIGIIGYQIAFSGGGNSLGPTIVALTIPAAIAVVFVLVRSSVRGDINVKRVLKERIRNFDCFFRAP